MHIFIDESGTFVPSATNPAISLVGALVVPDQQRAKIERAYQGLRPELLTEKGEVKGRLLSEWQVAALVALLRRHGVLFETTAIDMGIHSADDVAAHQSGQAQEITRHLSDAHSPSLRGTVVEFRRQLEGMSAQLYVQAVVMFDLVWRVIEHSTFYYSQRRPSELGAFHWVVDAKDKKGTTAWEAWWHDVVGTMLQSRSLKEPLAVFEEGDYSHFNRLARERSMPEYLRSRVRGPVGEQVTNVTKVMREDFRFSDQSEPELEMVDVLVNATRRALMGHLKVEGWRDIRELIIKQREKHSIQLLSLHASPTKVVGMPYWPTLLHFSARGRLMLAPRFRTQ